MPFWFFLCNWDFQTSLDYVKMLCLSVLYNLYIHPLYYDCEKRSRNVVSCSREVQRELLALLSVIDPLALETLCIPGVNWC